MKKYLIPNGTSVNKRRIKKMQDFIRDFITRIVEDVRNNDLSDNNLINKYTTEGNALIKESIDELIVLLRTRDVSENNNKIGDEMNIDSVNFENNLKDDMSKKDIMDLLIKWKVKTEKANTIANRFDALVRLLAEDVKDFLHKVTLGNLAFLKSSGLAGEGIKFKNMPLWVRIRYKLWIYCRYQYWKTERPLIKKTNKLYKQFGIDGSGISCKR